MDVGKSRLGTMCSNEKLLKNLIGGTCKKGVFKFKSEERKHYWNFINGIHVDLTWGQMVSGTWLYDVQDLNEEELISDKWMQKRYHNLE